MTPIPAWSEKILKPVPPSGAVYRVTMALRKGCGRGRLPLPVPPGQLANQRGSFLELCLHCMFPFVLRKYFIVITSVV